MQSLDFRVGLSVELFEFVDEFVLVILASVFGRGQVGREFTLLVRIGFVSGVKRNGTDYGELGLVLLAVC